MPDRRAEGVAPVCGAECRHQLFDTSRKRAELTISQLWVLYLGLGGRLDLFSIEAYLHGLTPLPAAQQDVLANAINEQLDDLCQAAKVPYLHTAHEQDPAFTELAYEDPVEVLDHLLSRGSPAPPQQP